MAEQTSQKPGSSYLRTNMKSLKTLAQNHVFLSYSSLDIALLTKLMLTVIIMEEILLEMLDARSRLIMLL